MNDCVAPPRPFRWLRPWLGALLLSLAPVGLHGQTLILPKQYRLPLPMASAPQTLTLIQPQSGHATTVQWLRWPTQVISPAAWLDQHWPVTLRRHPLGDDLWQVFDDADPVGLLAVSRVDPEVTWLWLTTPISRARPSISPSTLADELSLHGLSLHHDFMTLADGVSTRQRIYSHPSVAPQPLVAKLSRFWHRQGWRPTSAAGLATQIPLQAWQRGGQERFVQIVPWQSGSGLIIFERGESYGPR